MYDFVFYCIIFILYFIVHMCECHNYVLIFLLTYLLTYLKICVQRFCALIMCPKYCNFRYFLYSGYRFSVYADLVQPGLIGSICSVQLIRSIHVCNMSSRKRLACRDDTLQTHVTDD